MARRYKLMLIFLIIFIVSTILRFYPLIQNYSLHPAGFGGPNTYNIMYIIDTGQLLKSGAVQTFTPFGSTIYNLIEYPHLQILDAITSVIAGGPSSSWIYLIVKSVLISISFYLVLLSFYISLNEKIRSIDLLVISLFIFLGTPTIINGIAMSSNAFYSWLLIGFWFLLYYKYNHGDVKRKILLIFISIILILIYFTPSLVFLSFLSTLFIYRCVNKRKDLNVNFLVLYILLFVSYSLYIGTLRFNSTVNMFDGMYDAFIRDGLTTLLTGSTIESNVLNPYLISTSIQNKIIRLINAILVAIPLFYFLFFGSKKLKNEKLDDLIWSYSLNLFPLGVLFSLWLGIWGFWRLAEWGGLISLITFSSIIGLVNKKTRIVLITFALLAILTSSYAYITDENLPTNKITYAEQSNVLWIKQNFKPTNDQVFFTDMRLGGSLVGEGYFKVVGLQDKRDQPANLINFYKDIYLKNDSFLAQTALSSFTLQNGQKVSYILFSEQMTNMVPGIRVYSYTLKPPSENFISNYDNYSFVNNIYNNGVSKLYSLN